MIRFPSRLDAAPCLARAAIAIAMAAAFGGGPAVASPTIGAPIGLPEKVNLDAPGTRQAAPDVWMDAAGNITQVWLDYDADGIFLRGADHPTFGPVQIRLDDAADPDVNPPAIAGNKEGRTAVVWTGGLRTGFSNYFTEDPKVYLRCQAPGQAAQKVVVHTMATQLFHSGNTSVAMDDDGDIVVVWQEYVTPILGDYQTQIRMRRYKSDCTPNGSATVVASSIEAGSGFLSLDLDVAMSAGGDTVVVWSTWAGVVAGEFDHLKAQIEARRYNAAGVAQGAVIPVTTMVADRQDVYPKVATTAAGAFIVTWESDTANEADVYAREYTAGGSPLAAEYRVNTFSTGTQGSPDVAQDRDGDTVIVWDGMGPTGEGLYGRRFPNGLSFGNGEFRIDPPTPTVQSRGDLAIAMDADGDFTVAWGEIRDEERDVYRQRFVGFENVDVAATITDSPTQGEAHASGSYTVSLQNLHAPSADTGVGLASGLKVRMTTSNGFVGPTGGVTLCDVPFGSSVSCTTASIPAGGSKNVSFVVVPATEGQATVGVDVTSDPYDANLGNNADVETTPVGPDATPDNLADFEDKVVWGKGVQTTSNRVKLTGFDAPAPISVQEGFEYQVNYGRFTRNAGTVRPGDSVRLRMRSAENRGQVRTMTVVVGKASAQWSVTTRLFGQQ